MTVGRASREAIWRRLDEMASLGLPLYVTELSLFDRWVRFTHCCAWNKGVVQYAVLPP